MEGRCSVEPWGEFGLLGKQGTPKVKFGFGTTIFICTGYDEVCVFSANERKLTVSNFSLYEMFNKVVNWMCLFCRLSFSFLVRWMIWLRASTSSCLWRVGVEFIVWIYSCCYAGIKASDSVLSFIVAPYLCVMSHLLPNPFTSAGLQALQVMPPPVQRS